VGIPKSIEDSHIYGLMRVLGVDQVPRPCSVDLRARAIGAVEAGASRREAAEHFDLSPSAVIKWVKRFRETGNVMAKPCGGSTSPLDEYEDWLLALVAEQPDATLDEIVAAMRKRGVPGSRTAVWRFFQRHNITVKKKSLRATEREREDVAKARRRWMRQQGLFDPARLVFIALSDQVKHFLAFLSQLSTFRPQLQAGQLWCFAGSIPTARIGFDMNTLPKTWPPSAAAPGVIR
jgi:transposase